MSETAVGQRVVSNPASTSVIQAASSIVEGVLKLMSAIDGPSAIMWFYSKVVSTAMKLLQAVSVWCYFCREHVYMAETSALIKRAKELRMLLTRAQRILGSSVFTPSQSGSDVSIGRLVERIDGLIAIVQDTGGGTEGKARQRSN